MLPNLTHWMQNDWQPEFTAVCGRKMERQRSNRLVTDIKWGVAVTLSPAGGCQNSSNQEHCNTLPEALHDPSSWQKYVLVFLSSVYPRDTCLTLNVTSVPSLNWNQPTFFHIRWTLDALLYFLPVYQHCWLKYLLFLFTCCFSSI